MCVQILGGLINTCVCLYTHVHIHTHREYRLALTYYYGNRLALEAELNHGKSVYMCRGHSGPRSLERAGQAHS